MASYSAVIDLRVNGLRGLKTIEDRVKAIQNIQKELKPIPGIFDKRTTAELKKAKEELSKYVNEVGKGAKNGQNFSKTLAGLNAQMRAFSTVAANANVGSDEFVNGLRAAERASIELKKAEIERLRVLTSFYTPKTVGRSTATQEILNLGKNIPKSIAGLELYQQQLQETLRLVVAGSDDYLALSRAIAQVNRQLAIAQGLGPVQGPALPPGFTEAGATGFPRSPLSARPRQAAGRRGGNVLVGAAFPALFGAGPAGILGGAIGEAFGPLGGVVGSALGAPVDAFVAKTVEAGQALNSTSSALDFVRERSLFSSKATEELAYQLEELGDVEGVAKLLTEELVEKIGNNGVQALQDLGKESDETTRLWNELTLQLQALIAGPLTDFLKIVNQVLGSMTTRGRFEALQSDLAGNQEFQTEVNKLRTQRGRGARQGALTIEDMQGLINKFAPTVPKTAKIDVTPQDRRDFAVKDKKQADDAARAAGELFRLNAQITSERIRQLDIGTRYRQLIFGETEGLRQQNERLNDRRDLQIQQIEQERAQALQRNKYAENETAINELYDKRIETVKGEIALTQQQNLRRLELLDIEREITNQQRERAMMRELTAVNRSIERTGLRAQSPFGGDEQERQLQLLDQRIRREDSLQQFLERKAALEAEIRRLPEQATTEIDNLKQRIKREEELQASLQQRFEILDQLEQAELRQAQIVEKYGFIADEVATAMSSAVMAVVTGTGTVEEAFATMFQNIGKAFIDMATQMLAQQLFMTVLKALGGGFGGGPLGNGVPANPLGRMMGPNPLMRADGGAVMPGNTYMVGERGPELLQLNRNGSGQVINNNQLSSAMNRYRRSGTTSTNESAAMMQGGEGGTAVLDKPIDVRYTVDRINNVDYVTAAQFQAGMQQAAQQGAQRGEQQTIKRLQMSSSTRRRIGL